MSKDMFNLITVVMYLVIIFGSVVFLSWMSIQKKKNIEKAKDCIRSKIIGKLSITAKEVIYIGRGFDLSPTNSRDAVYKLFSEINSIEGYEKLKVLVAEIEKDEPFDELPDEVKPSLSRVAKLIDASTDSSDKNIILPITSTLNKYVELKAEQEKSKRQTSRAYMITIISFVVGAIGFYFTLTSPGEKEMKQALEQVLVEREKEFNQKE